MKKQASVDQVLKRKMRRSLYFKVSENDYVTQMENDAPMEGEGWVFHWNAYTETA